MSRKSYKKSLKSKLSNQREQKNYNMLYEQTLKQIREVNSLLNSLERHHKTGTWATKKLINRLNNNVIDIWQDSKGRLKVPKKVSHMELIAIRKALTQFINSKTSTNKGIKSVKDKTIKSIIELMTDIDDEEKENEKKVNEEDAEFYYSMLGDSDFDYFSDKIHASTLWVEIEASISNNDSEEDWINKLEKYVTINDEDVRNRAIRLYEKYIE